MNGDPVEYYETSDGHTIYYCAACGHTGRTDWPDVSCSCDECPCGFDYDGPTAVDEERNGGPWTAAMWRKTDPGFGPGIGPNAKG